MPDSDIEDFLETHTPYSVNIASTYDISKHSASSYGSYAGSGANGGLAAADVHVLERTGRNELSGLDIVTCVALIQTRHGNVIMLMNRPTMVGTIPSILLGKYNVLTIQMMANLSMLEEKQVIIYLDGYTTPFQCRSGLMYMSILGKPTDQDFNQY